MKELLPLKYSHTNGKVEAELKDLLIRLFELHLCERAADVNVYGAPCFGSSSLNKRFLASNDISAINNAEIKNDRERLSYLTRALTYNNQKRGVWLLRTFIRCLWGNEFEIQQLWQPKEGTYPVNVKSEEEIIEDGKNLDDYFLTSRLRILLQSDAKDFPQEVAHILKGTVPARLLIAEIFKELVVSAEFPVKAVVSGAYSVKMFSSESIDTYEFDQSVHMLPYCDGKAYSIRLFTAG